MIEVGKEKEYDVSLLPEGGCWNKNSTMFFNALLRYRDDANNDLPVVAGMVYPLSSIKSLYLIADSASSNMDDVKYR